MGKGTSRIILVCYRLAVTLLVLVNVIPLAGEVLFTLHGWKSYFLDFNVVDESGRAHSGFLGLGSIPLADGEIFQYAFQNGDEEASSARKRPVTLGPDADGFVWGDRGHLWAGSLDYLPARRGLVDGARIGRKIEPWQQGELSGPGAPWDIQGPLLSVLGQYPVYTVEYENDYFKLELAYRSRSRGWYLWNQGETFRTGDFGHGNMSELPCNVTGQIVHKARSETFAVTGYGVMETAVGTPWNWFEWGSHNWFSSNYPNGWAVGFWLAPDDWQWGYHVSPHEMWVYDPARNQYYHGKRVEFLEYDWGYDDIHHVKYPKAYRVRGATNEGVAEISATSVSYKPILVDVKYSPLDIHMTYSRAVMQGTFTYPDGTSVALTDGRGTMEFYPRTIPDMIYITPWSLALLVLLVGGRRITLNLADRKKVRHTLRIMLACWAGIAALTLYWL